MGNFPTKYTPQEILNYSTDTNVAPPTLLVGLLEWNGSGYTNKTSSQMNIKITEIGDFTYIAKAPIGTAQATAGWQVFRIEESGGDTVFLWCDANNDFDNVATDLTVLSYS